MLLIIIFENASNSIFFKNVDYNDDDDLNDERSTLEYLSCAPKRSTAEDLRPQKYI